MDKYRVALEAEERAELERMVSSGKASARKLNHARILLLADVAPGRERRRDDDIVDSLGVSLRTIARVRQLFVTEGFRTALDRKAQPPRPDKIKIKGDAEQRLVQLACSEPPEGCAHWTLQLLADELVALGLVKSLSPESVRTALKKTTSTRGSSTLGACRPTPTENLSGEWKMLFRPI